MEKRSSILSLLHRKGRLPLTIAAGVLHRKQMMAAALRFPSANFFSSFHRIRDVLRVPLPDDAPSTSTLCQSSMARNKLRLRRYASSVKPSSRISIPGVSSKNKEKFALGVIKNKTMVPDSSPPSRKDVDQLYEFFEQSNKLVVLTGAGLSTESGIPDYRSPNGAYSSGFRPITHQEFLRSAKARRRYWAGSYAGWRRFNAAQPSAGHTALASLEKSGRIHFMITQNVDRLHHRAGSNPLELHGTVYTVVCIDCSHSLSRHSFQDELKARNTKWAEAIDNLKLDTPGSDKSFGMRIRPDGDIDIDEKFWEEDFDIPPCPECNGVLKPDVVFFGDNVPKDNADTAMEAARECDALLVVGSSVMTMSAFRLVRAAHDAGAATAIINIGVTKADDIVPLKISARCGEILPRLLNTGTLAVPLA